MRRVPAAVSRWRKSASLLPVKPLPVAIVVVSWNSGPALETCLRSALAQQPAEIVVIDNASTDGTRLLLRRQFPQVKTLLQSDNVGFAQGCNLGVAATVAPFVLFLNDDAVLEAGYLATLVAALRAQPSAASAIGKLTCVMNGVRIIDSAGIELCAYALRPLDRGHGEVDVGQYDTPQDIFGPSGAAALYRRAALSTLADAPFDQNLFAYYEDVDLAWRLRRLGFRHLYVPSALAQHTRRGPAQKPADIAARAFVNRYVVWLKNESWQRFATYAPVALPWESVRLLRIGLRNPRALGRIVKHAAARTASALT